MRLLTNLCLILSLALGACTRSAPINTNFTPPAPVPTTAIANPGIPVAAPLQTYLPSTRAPGSPIPTPTANGALMPTFTPGANTRQDVVTPTPGPVSYVVQQGDYPASIAEQFGISVEELLATNNLGADAVIFPGDTLLVPATGKQSSQNNSSLVSSADYFKIIPDSELVYGPLSAMLDVDAFVQKKSGFLAFYTQDVNGVTLSGSQIVTKVAQNYSVNPRLLLALLEYRAEWVTNPNPAASTTTNPIGYVDDFHQGLYRQLTWSADMLNQGFYRWKEGKIQTWILLDGTQIVPQPGINPGTAAVQHLFSKLDDQTTWGIDVGANGFFATYSALFGYPFDWAIEPLLPASLTQPSLTLPFEPGQIWQFTGGPHAGWDQGSSWAALDFAPPGEPIGCGSTDAWVTASAPGLIVRTGEGQVIEDLDSDGLEQTGWVLLYMHVETRDRVLPGTRVQIGDRIGHPSCEGGMGNATHLHLARRYNGLWIPAADPRLPFVIGGFIASGTNVEYDGWLTSGNKVVEALEGRTPLNEISR